MYRKELERVSPESVGISSGDLKEMLARLESCGTEMHSIMIARHGKVVSECWWAPYHKDLVHICHSFGKSYMCTAIGVACTEGLLTVDDKIADIFSDEIKEYGIPLTENLKKLTVKHVLTMTNGMTEEVPTGAGFIKSYLSAEITQEPGSTFRYNTAGSCMLGAIIHKLTGMNPREYLTPRVFEKIGLETDKLGWISFRNGINAAPGVSSNTENNLRLGMLFLNGGEWDGERIIDRDFIREATKKQIDNDNGSGPREERCGYGYQLWHCRVPGVYRFDGGHGQISVMSPEDDMVITIQQAASMPSDVTAVFDVLNDYFYSRRLPESLPEDTKALAELRDFEKTRSMPAPEKRALPDSCADWNGIYRVTEGHFHVNPELRPYDTLNVYEDFYEDNDVDVKNVSIYFRSPESCELVLNDIFRFDVRMDGVLSPVHTGSKIPEYYMTYSSGYFEDKDTLVINTRYFQTCFKTLMTLKKTEDGIKVDVRKEILHDAQPYYYYHAAAKRVK